MPTAQPYISPSPGLPLRRGEGLSALALAAGADTWCGGLDVETSGVGSKRCAEADGAVVDDDLSMFGDCLGQGDDGAHATVLVAYLQPVMCHDP